MTRSPLFQQMVDIARAHNDALGLPGGLHDWRGKKIVTEFVYPPIPIRTSDWSAALDGYEPGDCLGYGATEREAIEDLREQLEERE